MYVFYSSASSTRSTVSIPVPGSTGNSRVNKIEIHDLSWPGWTELNIEQLVQLYNITSIFYLKFDSLNTVVDKIKLQQQQRKPNGIESSSCSSPHPLLLLPSNDH